MTDSGNGEAAVVVTSQQQRQQRFALFLVRSALGISAFGLSWLAYVDAPITDLAMLLLVAALLACVLAATCALTASAYLSAARTESGGGPQRLCRAAVASLLVGLMLMISACVFTLNLKGTDTNEGTEAKATATVIAA
jgi:hypothetical protein